MRAGFSDSTLPHKSTGLQPAPLHLSLFAIGLNGLGSRRDLFRASLVNRVNGAVILFCAPRGFLRLVMRAGVLCSLPIVRCLYHSTSEIRSMQSDAVYCVLGLPPRPN